MSLLSLFLEKRLGAPLGKVRFNLLVGNGGTRIIQGFAHLGAKPGVVLGGVLG
jgi:hypothetical protein